MPDWSIPRGIAGARHLVEVAQGHGASLAVCLEGSGVSPATIRDAEAEITLDQELRLFRNVIAALPQVEGLALEVGSRFQLTDFGIWGYALFSSRSLREALRVALRYLDLSAIFGELDFVERGNEAWLRMDYRMVPAEIRQFLIERDTASIWRVQRLIDPRPAPPLRMQFEFPAPAYAHRYQELLGTKPEFGAKETMFVLDPRVFDQPLPQANEATARMCEAECQKLLARRRARSGTSARVRDIILRRPAQAADMEVVSAELCMTSRTLRRHLADENTSFRALRDEVLMTLAEELIGTAHMKLAEVAERLGYSDAAAFSHAFKRWRGVTPGAARSA
ncbi:MAG TPA: AraC family transcriptional regulator [Nevskia sp.]|nr:AraC family transcriptional regulator [Nevskia sp.]